MASSLDPQRQRLQPEQDGPAAPPRDGQPCRPAVPTEPAVRPFPATRLTDPPSWPPAVCAGAKVLIVENEDSNRMLMEKILTLVGYECVSACNGQEALDVFLRERPHIVLTDISMPVMDGFEEIARLRSLPEGAHVPIIAVTAHAMSGDREYALREGCNEYLVKPYRPRDLVELVDRLLKEASRSGGE